MGAAGPPPGHCMGVTRPAGYVGANGCPEATAIVGGGGGVNGGVVRHRLCEKHINHRAIGVGKVTEERYSTDSARNI